MNKFVKTLLIIVSLLLLAGLVLTMGLLVNIPLVTAFSEHMFTNYYWFGTLLAVVMLFFTVITVVSILCDFFLPNPKDKMVMDRDGGQIEISDKSIESVASMAASEVPGVRRYSAKVMGKPTKHKVKLDVYAETDGTTGLTTTGQEIQQHVAQRLAETLDVKPHNIDVHMKPYADARAAKKVQAPRVI